MIFVQYEVGISNPLPVNLIISCRGIIIKKNEPLPIKLLRYFLFILRALIAKYGHDNDSVVMKGLQILSNIKISKCTTNWH